MSSEHKLTGSQRQQMIAEAAYFKAERRGFEGGDAVRDWCEAEAEIDARLLQLEDGQLIERVERALVESGKKLAAARRKLARLSTDTGREWRRELDKLAALRDSLEPKLVELKEQGARVGKNLRDQAEKMGDELAKVVQRLEEKSKQ